MRVSVNITNYSWPEGRLGAQLGSIVRAADDAGIDTVWVADHLLQADPASTPDAEMLEAQTAGYTVINSARWDRGLVRFLTRTIVKRSFRTYVLANLEANRAGSLPVLYRLV